MSCYHPWSAFQLDTGEIVFSERGKVKRELMLPCGHCYGCRLSRARSWALRCVHESKMHASNCFITLTYSDSNFYPSLVYRDFQLFMYRLRKVSTGVRFFMCGEYGSLNFRPHFHALLFNFDFSDRRKLTDTLDRSPLLEKLWPLGFSSVGSVSMESAGYVAKYSLKKVVGANAERFYRRVDPATGELVDCVPEFARMSLKPGIGYSWFAKYWKEVYGPRDGVVQPGGRVVPSPRYYDKLLEASQSETYEIKIFERYKNTNWSERTPARLAAREAVAIGKEKFNKQRSL